MSAWLVHLVHLTKSDCTNGFSTQRLYWYVLPKYRGVIQACGLAPVDVLCCLPSVFIFWGVQVPVDKHGFCQWNYADIDAVGVMSETIAPWKGPAYGRLYRPFLSIRFPWYYWRSSGEAWRSGSVVAWTHFTTTPRVTVQCICVTLMSVLQTQHLTSSMTIPWKPDAQKEVYI